MTVWPQTGQTPTFSNCRSLPCFTASWASLKSWAWIFRLQGKVEGPFRTLFTLELGGLHVNRIHLFNLMQLAVNGPLQVIHQTAFAEDSAGGDTVVTRLIF